MIQKVLAFETSCDDTSVSIVDHSAKVWALVSSTKDLDHEPYGGIVPEIASRNHSSAILPLIDEAFKKSQLGWKDIQGLVVTNRPGLIGALIVGLVTTKSLALSKSLPFVGVNHLEGHLLAPFLHDEEYSPVFAFGEPFLALAISGGHTTLYKVTGLGQYQILGTTQDDAAGEAFDKFAKMVGLGFPGGVRVDQKAKSGDPTKFEFPRSMIHDDSLNMSFSGLKSAAQRQIASLGPEGVQAQLADLCASFQQAVVDVLLAKLEKAADRHRIKRIVLTGGVSANSCLRTQAQELAQKKRWTLSIPPLRYCTDNAAMVGLAGILRLQAGERHDWNLGPSPQSWDGDFQK
ncbi:MAG: tRNA (adenosine(37)-N6)-threonylcarbamoyltransferase complex transferase subunit TsaD [Bdellovibrionales bacterium]